MNIATLNRCPMVMTYAFVMPVRSINGENLVPTSTSRAEEFELYKWDFKYDKWKACGLFEDLSKAEKAAAEYHLEILRKWG